MSLAYLCAIWLVMIWLSWGIAYPVTAVALAGFDVLTLRCLVQLIGATTLLVQLVVARRSFAIEREAWPDLVVSGLLNMAIFPICMTFGVYLMSPGRTSILVYTLAIWATVFAWWMLDEPLTRARLAAVALGAAAVVVMVSQDLSNLRNAPLGAALTLTAALSFGLGTVWLKRRRWRADPSAIAFWQIVIGLVPLLLVWAVFAAPPTLGHAGMAPWLALAFLGTISNGIAYFAWFRLVRSLPASIVGISSLAVPCVGVAASAWLVDEHLHAQDLAAMAMIGGALLIVLAEQWRRRPAAVAATNRSR